MEGKALAIDSSIWIYQFQATMRDKEGRALVNAHVLGFLRRICKLLFYGIRPVFVFDGGAPALKRNTIVRSSVRLRDAFSDVNSRSGRAQEEEEWCGCESCQDSRKAFCGADETRSTRSCPSFSVRTCTSGIWTRY